MIRQLWVQADDYTAHDDRLLFPFLLGHVPLGQIPQVRSLRHADDFAITWTDGTHAVVGAGWAYIGWAGTIYALVSDEATPLAFGAADPANARIDTIIGRVYDAEAGGPDQPPEIVVLPGQASQSPIAPAVPAGAIALYDARYNAGAASAVVTDRRTVSSHDHPIPAILARAYGHAFVMAGAAYNPAKPVYVYTGRSSYVSDANGNGGFNLTYTPPATSILAMHFQPGIFPTGTYSQVVITGVTLTSVSLRAFTVQGGAVGVTTIAGSLTVYYQS